MDKAAFSSYHQQQQQRHKLQLRQRIPQVPAEDIPGVTVSIPLVAAPSGGGGPGGPGRGNGLGNGPPGRGEASEEEDEDEDNGGTLSACSVTCLTAHLGNDCRTVSCMCSNPSIVNANTCMALTCPPGDRLVFLTNIRNWCGRGLAASLSTPGRADTLSTTIPLARTRSSTELSSASSPIASLSRTEALLSPLSRSTVLESSAVETSAVSSATSRSVVIRTTTAAASATDDEVFSTTATGRVNPKVIAADITTTVDPDTINASSSSSSNDKNDGSQSKGLTTGSIAGIAIGMILAFAIVGLCAWYVRKQLMGRTKRGKEFLRSSDHGDWVSGGDNNNNKFGQHQDSSTRGGGGAAASAGFNEKDGESLDEDENGGNDRIERTMSQRAGNSQIMLPSSSSDGQAGIGAYTRSFPTQPHSSMISTSSSGRRHQHTHDSMQSQKQYDEMQAALAYPSHVGIQPSSPYHVHPQHYSTMSMPVHQPTAVYYTPQQQQQLQLQQQQQQQQQQQMNMQAAGHAYRGNPLPSIPQQQQDIYTPRNSLQPPPSSAGIDSNVANHSHYESGSNSAFNSPFPESIHDSPETGHVIHGMNAAATTPQIGKHQSIPFIIPAQIPMAGSQDPIRQSQRILSLQSGQHIQGLPRSLTAGQGDLSSSPSASASAPPSLTGPATNVAQVQQQEDQKRATHYMAQGVPLPTSPPPQGPLPLPVLAPSQMPMPMPGAATLDTGKGKEVDAENPFLDDAAKNEKDDDEGLPYLI